MKKDISDATKVIIFFCFIFSITSLMINLIPSFNDHTKIITVTDKERVNSSGSSEYLIMGEDENGDTLVLENTDTWMRFKFNSSDIYAELKEGETYEVKVIGFRIPFLSLYENILSYKEVK